MNEYLCWLRWHVMAHSRGLLSPLAKSISSGNPLRMNMEHAYENAQTCLGIYLARDDNHNRNNWIARRPLVIRVAAFDYDRA